VQVTLPDGTVILAQGRLDLVPSERPRPPDFAMYLDDRWHGDTQVTWPYRMIGWPDFGLPSDEAEVFTAVVDIHQRARTGQLVEIACYGGVGRTGTVLGCLAVLAGIAPSDAVRWVRDHYHPSAVETRQQEQLIARFAQTLNRSD
jgi:protein-tyrosine phosphatase